MKVHEHRASMWDYVRANEALLQAYNLSEEEERAVREMLARLIERFAPHKQP